MKSELKKCWFTFKEKINSLRADDPIMIAPYRSYANEHEVIIRGRVLENEGIVVKEDDGKWDNFVNSIKRMESDEVINAKVCIRYENKEYNCRTNEEGYFKISIPAQFTETNSSSLKWSKAQLWLPDTTNDNDEKITAEVDILLPSSNSQFAIITDVDDTILQSHVNSFMKLRLLYETFLKNVNNRLAFENIGKILSSLTQNESGQTINPIFFLSHSPWNLYNLLQQFLEKNDIPKGPFFLRDFGYKKGKEKYEYENHKSLSIEHLFTFYPDLSFILLGDATEHDVDIYTEAFTKYPDRILNIFIRATEKEEKNNHVREVQKQNPKAPIFLIKHSDEILEILKQE